MRLRRGRPYLSSPAADMLCLILSNFGIWTALGPLPRDTLVSESAAALIWIKPRANRVSPGSAGYHRNLGHPGDPSRASAQGLFRQTEFFEAGLGSAGEYTAQNNKRFAGERRHEIRHLL